MTRWFALVLLAVGCGGSVEEATITFPDPAAGDRLVDGEWRGSRSYEGPHPAKLRPLTESADQPCEFVTWDSHGRAAPWDRSRIIKGTIDLRAAGCDDPIKQPYRLLVELD